MLLPVFQQLQLRQQKHQKVHRLLKYTRLGSKERSSKTEDLILVVRVFATQEIARKVRIMHVKNILISSRVHLRLG